VGGPSETAQADALTAFNNLAGQPSDGIWSLNPAPVPGVWTAADSPSFSGPTLTLTGNANSVWVFQISTDFTFSGNVVLAGGAQACHVFGRWPEMQLLPQAVILWGHSLRRTISLPLPAQY